MTLDTRINQLQPGQSLQLGRTETCWTTVERTGDGKKLNFIRHTPNGYEIYRSTSF